MEETNKSGLLSQSMAKRGGWYFNFVEFSLSPLCVCGTITKESF